MYQLVSHHSGVNKQNQGKRILEQIEEYSDAVAAMLRVASSWYGFSRGQGVVVTKDRAEYTADRWSCAVYIEKV